MKNHKEIVLSFYEYRDEYSADILIDGKSCSFIGGFVALVGPSIHVGEISYIDNTADYMTGDESLYKLFFLAEKHRGYKETLSVFANGKFIYKVRDFVEHEENDDFIPIAKKVCEALNIKARFYYEYEKTVKVRKEC